MSKAVERPANPADVESIEAIIAAAYDSISGPPGKKRDWDRMRSLFISGAHLIPTPVDAGRNNVDLAPGRVRPNGGLAPQMLDIEGFIARAEQAFEKTGFYEKDDAFLFGRKDELVSQLLPLPTFGEFQSNCCFTRGRTRTDG